MPNTPLSSFDLTAPTVTLGPLTPTGSLTYTSAITLSEPAGNGTAFDQSDLTVGNGTATLSGSGTSFTATITPTSDGTVTLDIAANRFSDAAGNQNTAATQVSTTFDGTEPYIYSITRKTPASADTNADTLTFTVTFSEAVLNVDSTDFKLFGTSATVTSITGSGAVYDVTVSGGNLATMDGGVNLNFASAQNITDTSANAMSHSAVYAANDNYYSLDNTKPTVTLGALTLTGPNTYTSAITLSERAGNGTAFEQADLTVGNGTATLSGSGTSFTATITPTSDGTVTLDVAANRFSDAAGNQNTAATQVSTNHDGTAPTVTLGALTASGPNTYTSAITLSEAAGNGTAFDASDLTVGNGLVTGFTGSGTSFTATITPTGDGNVTLDVAANRFSDATGNQNTAATQVSTNHDGTAPTVTLGPLTSTGHRTYTTTITLSEPASNGTIFDASDLTVSNGSVTGFTGAGTNFTATFMSASTGQMSVEVAAASFTDAAGNDNLASNAVSVTVDAKKQTKELINKIIGNNARMVLQNKPRLARRLNRFKGGRLPSTGSVSAFGVSISNSGLPFEAKLNRDSGSFSFSLNQARQSQSMDLGKAKVSVDPFAIVGAVSPETRVDVAHAASFKAPASETEASHAMGYVPPSSQPVGNPQPASDFVEPLKYDAWIEASFGQQNLGDSKTKFAILHAGMDYLVTSNLLLGFGAQMDWADYDSKSSAAKAEGFGFLVGPYMTSKLSDHLYLDARLGWGQSYSDVSPLGTYKDDVTTNRILASFAVIGDFEWNAINITPQVRLSYFRDESDAYVDSQGSNIEANHLETGILEFGPAFAKTFNLANGLTLTPKLSADGVWTFAENSSNSDVTSSSGTGIRARLGAGLNIRTEDNLTVMFNGIYDGIGQSDYEAYRGTIRLSKQW